MKKYRNPAIACLGIILLMFTISCSKKDAIPASRAPNIKTKNVTYAKNVDYYGVQQDLKLDVYFPYQRNPQNIRYPLIIFVHGGGFVSGAKEAGEEFCRKMNDKGFVAVSIDYRLGWNLDTSDNCIGDSTQLKEAVYKSMQDLHAALRFLVVNAESYSIDPNNIFLAGSSAGAACILHTAYVTEDSANVFIPGVTQKLGPLYSAGNDIRASYTIKGLASMWGALYIPTVISLQSAIPTIFFHGEKDMIAPADEGKLYQCDNQMFVYGSKSLHRRMGQFNGISVAHIDPEGGHGVYDERFRTNNIGCFFNDVMSNTATRGYFEGQKSNCN